MFFAFFGAVWCAVGASRSLAEPLAAQLVAALVGAALLVYANRRRVTALSQFTPSPPTPAEARRDRWFHIVNAGQWVVILVVANVMQNIGLTDWIVPMVIVVVGLHFFPLARLFRYSAHIVTGALLILIALVYPHVTPGGPLSGLGPMATGLVLWGAAVYGLS